MNVERLDHALLTVLHSLQQVLLSSGKQSYTFPIRNPD